MKWALRPNNDNDLPDPTTEEVLEEASETLSEADCFDITGSTKENHLSKHGLFWLFISVLPFIFMRVFAITLFYLIIFGYIDVPFVS